jgi:uncharacterized membrane protein affecting hemolysin expression
MNLKVIIAIAIVVVLIVGYLMWDRKRKAQKKAQIDAQISAGGTTLSGQLTAGVKPDDSYDPSADVQRILNAQSWWNDDEEAIYDTIRKLGTKARLKKLREEFLRVKGKELDAWLAQEVFNDKEMSIYNNLIQSLK